MAVPEGASPVPLLQDLEEQLSHIEPYKLNKCALYQQKDGSFQIVEMNWLNRLFRFIRPSRYNTVAFVDKLCDVLKKTINDETLPVNYTKLTNAFTKMQGTLSPKLQSIGNILAQRETVPEFETFSKILNIAATSLPKENIVQELDAFVKGTQLPESCRLLRGHPALQQARDLLVRNTFVAMQEGIYSLDDFNAVIKSIQELDNMLGTKSDLHLSSLERRSRSLQKLEEKAFSHDLKKLCRDLAKGSIAPSHHETRVQLLLARAERIRLQNPKRFERPLRLIANAYTQRGYYQGAENLVELLNNFAQKHKIQPAIPASEEETVKQLAKLYSLAESVMAPDYGAKSGKVLNQFLRDCNDLKLNTNNLITASQNNPVVFRNLNQLQDNIADIMGFRVRLLKNNGGMLLDYRDLFEGLEVLQKKIGLAIPTKKQAAIIKHREGLLKQVEGRLNELKRLVLTNPLVYALEYSQLMMQYRNALTPTEFDAYFATSLEWSQVLNKALLPYLLPDSAYSWAVSVSKESLVQSFDAAPFKAQIVRAISGKFGEKLQHWVDLISNYESAYKTFERQELGKTMIGSESAEEAINKLLKEKKINLQKIEPEVKVALLCEALYERVKQLNPKAKESEQRAMVAELLAASPRDYNPISLPKTVVEALTISEKEVTEAKYRMGDARVEEQPEVLCRFELGLQNGKLQGSVQHFNMYELKEGEAVTGKQILFTSKLSKELGNNASAWQGTLSAQPKV